MASRKLVRQFLLSKQAHFLLRLPPPQRPNTRLQSNPYPGGRREFSVLKEFSDRLKGEVNKNEDFKKSVNELKEKAKELKVAKDDLTNRTKQKAEQLYKHVDGILTEAEVTAKKASADVKEKITIATEEVKESFGTGNQESTCSSSTSAEDGVGEQEEAKEKNSSTDSAETLFGKFKSGFPSPKVSVAYQKLKDAKVPDFVRKGYDVVKEELRGTPNKRKHLEYTPPPPFKGKISSKTDIVVTPLMQTRWRKKWGAFVEKLRGNPLVKRINGLSEPVVFKGQEIAEDMRERWDTSDSPLVHKIQDVSDTIFQETDAAASIKEIRRRDPSFSMPDFIAEVQEAIRPVLNAYLKGDVGALKKYCSPEVINRFEAERKAFESHGIFFENKILHISDVEVRETKMMGNSPLIVVAFQTQQVHCIRDRSGAITEGGKDTIHTVYYAWAMQQVDPEELEEGAVYPIWRLREMQQLGVQSLI